MGVSIFHIPLTFTEVKIPVIVVFNKHDLLDMEHYRGCRYKLSPADKRAKHTFIEVTKVPFVSVSTQKEALKEYEGPLI